MWTIKTNESWQDEDPRSKSATLLSKEKELERLKQKRRDLEVDLDNVDRQIRKADVEANDIRASLGTTPDS